MPPKALREENVVSSSKAVEDKTLGRSKKKKHRIFRQLVWRDSKWLRESMGAIGDAA